MSCKGTRYQSEFKDSKVSERFGQSLYAASENFVQEGKKLLLEKETRSKRGR